MSHDSVTPEQLNALLDGDLEADQAAALRQHIDTCEECRAEYEAMAQARQVLRDIPQPAVPEGLLASIKADAETELAEPAAPSIWSRWRIATAVAAAAAVLLAVFTPWQALHEDEVCEVCPPTETPSVVAEAPADDQDAPLAAATPDDATDPEPVTDGTELAQAPPAEPEMNRTPRRRSVPRERRVGSSRPVEVAVSPEPTPAPAEVAEPAVETVREPALASAPVAAEPSSAVGEPLMGEADRATVIAMGPRTTVEDEPTLAPARSPELETEMATGVIAEMVLNQYVAEHMVESSSTMLSVVTDTPTSELGPVLAEDEDEPGSFGFSFTDAMRRALTESENQVP
jgi:anti-sigma factor (TIGR02949 family)